MEAQPGEDLQRALNAAAAARLAFAAAPTNTQLAWELGRACFDVADLRPNREGRAAAAAEGENACRAALDIDPDCAPANYYLSLNLGQDASVRSVGALRLVREMERHLLRAHARLPAFDHYGPDRSLGLLYLEAPGWPISIGSHARARLHLEAAVRGDPGFPENRLSLAEFYEKGRHHAGAVSQLAALDALWLKAKKEFAGRDWERSWADWEARRNALRQRLR